MSSAPSLKVIVISKFNPEEMMKIIDIMEKKGCKFNNIIKNELAKYDTSVHKAHDFNRTYDGWWGCPHKLDAYTIKPELMSNHYD